MSLQCNACPQAGESFGEAVVLTTVYVGEIRDGLRDLGKRIREMGVYL